jgi:RNA polymerase sigma factor (sigma-70 family)
MTLIDSQDIDDRLGAADLVNFAISGQRWAWERLVVQYAPLVRAIVKRFGIRTGDAEDVVQTVWLRTIEHLQELREPRALPGWIAVVTRRECIRAVERSRRIVLTDTLDEQYIQHSGDRNPEGDVLLAELQRVLFLGIADLSERQRKLLLLLMTDPQPAYDRISSQLGMPIGSIGPTRARALKKLRHSPGIKSFSSERSSCAKNRF